MYVVGAVNYYNRDNDCIEATRIKLFIGGHNSLTSRISIVSLYGIWGHSRSTFFDVVDPNFLMRINFSKLAKVSNFEVATNDTIDGLQPNNN